MEKEKQEYLKKKNPGASLKINLNRNQKYKCIKKLFKKYQKQNHKKI